MALGPLTTWLQAASNRKRHQHLRPGDYAGRAVFRPRKRHHLRPDLYKAIGTVVHVMFVGVAAKGDAFAGQRLYQECDGGQVLRSFVPQQDLQFLNDGARPPSRRPRRAS